MSPSLPWLTNIHCPALIRISQHGRAGHKVKSRKLPGEAAALRIWEDGDFDAAVNFNLKRRNKMEIEIEMRRWALECRLQFQLKKERKRKIPEKMGTWMQTSISKKKLRRKNEIDLRRWALGCTGSPSGTRWPPPPAPRPARPLWRCPQELSWSQGRHMQSARKTSSRQTLPCIIFRNIQKTPHFP